MLSVLRKNILSIVISCAAVSGYSAWLSLPESASFQSVYDRYIAREESRPRLFEDGITVRMNREAPPVAALEEALRDQPWTLIERSPGFNVKPTILRVVPSAPERMAVQLLSENENFRRVLISQSVALDGRRQPSTSTVNSAVTTPISAPVVLPQNRVRTEVASNRRGVSYVAGVAGSLNSRPLEVLSVPAAPAPTKVFSLSKNGLTREQLLAALFMPMSQSTLPAAAAKSTGAGYVSGFATTIGKASAPASNKKKSIWDSGAASRPAELGAYVASNNGNGAGETEQRPAQSFAPDVSEVSSRAMGMVAPTGRQIMIRGPIEFSGGLALTHAKDRIAVLRESRGQFVESGAVWIRDARYEIFVESLEGQLVAEVRSPQGDVVGRGHIDLSSVQASGDRKNYDGVALKVLPIRSGISGTAQSPYATGSASKGMLGAHVAVQQTTSVMKSVAGGHFEDTKFADGSRVIANVQAKDHWPTMAMLTSGQDAVVPVYSKKMMKAFVSLTSKDEDAADRMMKTKGVIWGHVTRAGQSVAGAKVEVITQGAGDPIYFNDLMLPDATLSKTGSNGLFAVPATSKGAHAVQVSIGTRLSDPVFLKAEAGTVSALELDVLKASEVQAHAYDAFRTDFALRADVRPMGHVRARHMTVEGDAGSIVKLANLGHPTILNVDGGSDYLYTRLIQNPETRNLFIPMVSRSWYDLTLGRIKYNALSGTGNVIGFIQGSRFRVSMDETSVSTGARVIYFDSRGEVSSHQYGEPGGGFLILGVVEGLQTVVVEAENSDQMYAATVLVEDGVVAAVNHWLR